MPDSQPGNTGPVWAQDERYVAVVKSLRSSIPTNLHAVIDTTECFGLFHVEGEGQCPDAVACPLMTFCKQSWQLVNIRSAAAASAPLTPKEEKITEDMENPVPWEDAVAKHARVAYEDHGRLVDRLLDAFLEVFIDLPKLPANWHHTKLQQFINKYGKHLMSATPSFHTIRRGEVILVRFWTNNARWPLVDVTPDLVEVMVESSKELGTYTYGPAGKKKELLQLEPPERHPDKNWWKVRPCTHRVIVRTQTAARVVGHAVRAYYKF